MQPAQLPILSRKQHLFSLKQKSVVYGITFAVQRNFFLVRLKSCFFVVVVIGGFSSEFTIDRNDYGVGVGNYAATAIIGGEVNVKLNLEVSRTDP